MAQALTSRKRLRKQFGSIGEVAEMPNLIEVQKASYDDFLMVKEPPGGRPDDFGLQSVFKSVFPISDFAGKSTLEFVSYEFEPPKFDVDECMQRDMTYAAPLKVKLRLIVFDVNEETGSKSIKDVKEQDVYMGDMPLMTLNGTFIINGTERVIVSQMHRSPGVFFDHDRGKTHSSGKLLFAARIIPYRGSWLDFEFDAKDNVYVRIDRRRKLPVTTMLYALGLDDEEILAHFYKHIPIKESKRGWKMPYFADKFRGVTPQSDIADAKTGEVIARQGEKITARRAREIAESGVKEILISAEDLAGRFIAEDIVDLETGKIFAEAGDELDAELLTELKGQKVKEFHILDIDYINVGAFIRNTLNIDKNANQQEALMDIYRVMRPGEPPTIEAATALFQGLFFDPERFDLSAVGRVKMNMRLELDAPDTMRVLRREDILAVVKTLVDLRDGKGEIDDIDHLGNRRVRSVGELMENQYRVGLLRMERAIKERMSSVEIDTVMPQDLINAKPAAAAVREFFGSSQLSQFMDQTNPLSEITHKRRLSALGPGGLDARACRFRGARRASDALRPHLPDRDAGRSEHRPHQLARDVRARQQVRLHREPVSQGRERPGDGRGRLPLRNGGNAPPRRPGERRSSMPKGKLTEDLVTVRHNGDVMLVPTGQGRLHRRVAEAARVGGRGSDPVPRERRRQPRAYGLEHAAPGGAADQGGSAACRHRHGRARRAGLRARPSPHAAPASSIRWMQPVSLSAQRKSRIRRSRASTSIVCASSSARTRTPASTSGR